MSFNKLVGRDDFSDAVPCDAIFTDNQFTESRLELLFITDYAKSAKSSSSTLCHLQEAAFFRG